MVPPPPHHIPIPSPTFPTSTIVPPPVFPTPAYPSSSSSTSQSTKESSTAQQQAAPGEVILVWSDEEYSMVSTVTICSTFI